MTRLQRFTIVFAILALAATAAACGGGSSDSSSSAGSGGASEDIKGQTITVLIPYQMPKSLLDKFTAETGVKVNYVVTGWDATHNKLLVANEAQTYLADVAEFDWSFTGQFAGAGWVEPLNGLVDEKTLDDLESTDKAFISGGKTYAACYSNDFRVSMFNKQMFQKAGLDGYPATFNDLSDAVTKLKASGVQYPLSIPMGATEGGVTPWYLLTLAMGGQLFDSQNNPVFADPGSAGYKALQWEVDAVKNGWVSPGSVTLDDGPSLDKFNAGAGAIQFASSPGNLPTSNDPKQSSIAPHAKGGLIPGESGPGSTFGLPEGLAIPVTAKHKDAARAFIEFWMEPQNQKLLYKQAGMLPCRSSVVSDMAAKGEIEGGNVVSEQFKHVQPLFPQGAPKWYSKFSSEAQGLLNSAVKGNTS